MTDHIKPEILTAAQWLAKHRSEWQRPLIPFVRDRFSFSALEAIDALKQAHSLTYVKNEGAEQ